ncbi:MAG: DUF4332 domain-containing protein [Acidobacteria bacterium]|nr:DUF4332 domain-containing protein [Acidobacteriota bacterium]
MKIEAIEGIGPVYGQKLRSAGVTSVAKLLKAGAGRSDRKKLAEASGIDEKKLLDLVNMADLFRIKGIASQYAELLKAVGVDTVKELKMRNCGNLCAKMKEVNDARKLVRQLPSQSVVDGWIHEAASLPPVITH